MRSFPRGAEWRKWDLHVHTPASFSHEYCRTDTQNSDSTQDDIWKVYVESLENIPEISVLGVTDYYSIEGYKKLLELRQQNRLTNFDTLLPNIELRLTVTAKGKKLHYHVLFSELLPPDIIETEFLRKLEFESEGGERLTLTKENIEALGAGLKRSESQFAKATDYAVGCMSIYLDPRQIRDLLDQKKGLFGGKYLLVLSGAEWSGLPWKGQTNLLRKNLLMSSHAVFTGNPSDIDWAHGRGDLSEEEFEKEFGCLKACLHGSDAHDFNRLCCPDLSRFCWIKADPTFEGLKQAICEPTSRIHVGPTAPTKTDRARIIRSVALGGSSRWFEDGVEIPVNESLVTVIGGRGTGKTALLDLIAFAAGSFEPSEKSFLATAPRDLEGATVTVEWADGSKTGGELRLNDLCEHTGQDEEQLVRYLTQSFAERLCKPQHFHELNEQIEKVVFQSIPQAQRGSFRSFDELRKDGLEPIYRERSRIDNQLRAVNARIAEAWTAEKEIDGIDERLRDKIGHLGRLRVEHAELLIGMESKELLQHLEELSKKRKERATLLDQISSISKELSLVGNALGLIAERRDADLAFTNELRRLLTKTALSESFVRKVEAVLLPVELEDVLEARRKALMLAQDRLQGRSRDLEEKIEALGKQEQADTALRDQASELAETIESTRHQIRLEFALRRQKRGAICSLPSYLKERKRLVSEFASTLYKERQILEGLYSFVEQRIDKAEGEEGLFGIGVQVRFDLDSMSEAGNALIDHNKKGRYYNKANLALQEDICRAAVHLAESFENDETAFTEALCGFLEEVCEYFTVSEMGEHLDPESQLKKSYTLADFLNWLYGPAYYAVEYSISFQGLPLENVSPGMKGVALLILYLEMDRADRRPLLIDQPEESLDNRTVYSTLVEYFKHAKQRRQIMLITHNPNLAVNTDSEQVVVANFDMACAEQPARICYVAGSLGNTFVNQDAQSPLRRQGIREHVCEILEGGTEAFRQREMKYGLTSLLTPAKTELTP